MTLEKISYEDFDVIFRQMESNFIPDERREHDSALALLNNEKYTVYHVIDGDVRVGFITVWELKNIYFIEHFVIFEQYRNQGYGAAVLTTVKEKFSKIFLECEPPTFDIAKRRMAFYMRSGFVVNDRPYLQPPYRKDGALVPLVIMSYPMALDDFDGTVDELYRTVYNYKN